MKFCFSFLLLFFYAVNIPAQPSALSGTVERIKVHGKGLEGNLSGDSPDRFVSVYLPPGYKKNPKKRYPVIYFLHGYTDSDDKWYGFTKHWINLPNIADSIFKTGSSSEMILVTPNAFTQFQGSMYSNSVTTGNWEDYVAKELVAYMDSHYRTIAKKESRGLAGHSMGGYGAIRIGQKHPEIFSSIYLLSPCCLTPETFAPTPDMMARLEAIKDTAAFVKADFSTKILFAAAAAWSPNPLKPPLYLDLPVQNGKVQPHILDKWTANRPLAQLDQFIPNLRQLKAIAFDAGDRDKNIAESIVVLDSTLNNYHIQHSFEIYNGTHVNRIADRISRKMLAFFSENLSKK